MSTPSMGTLPEKYCIVGAGPAGLIAARAMRRAGIDVELLERHHEVGGIWNIDNAGSPMYETCNFIASRMRGGFVGYPMPTDYPDYPTWQQIRGYVLRMAADYGLRELVSFDTEVVHAEPVNTPAGTYWSVRLSSAEVRNYRGVIYAGGHEWTPNMPDIPGTDTFTGRIIHSRDYRSPAEFEDQRVLVVGAGNSGVDIASDAAFAANRAFLSTRRGYWFLPKQVCGVPITEYIDGSEPLPAHLKLGDLTEEERIEFMLSLIGDLTRFGLPAPDHPVTATHPIVSNTVLHYLAHGRLSWRPDVASVHGSRVEFVDGTTEEIDVIVCATGYDIEIPWVPTGLIKYRNGRPITHLSTFFPGLDNFYAVGIMHAADHGYENFDAFAQMIVADARATLTGENADAVHRLKRDYRPDIKAGEVEFIATRRNENQYSSQGLRQIVADLQTRFGIEVPAWDDPDFYRSQLVNEALAAQSA